MVTFLSAPLNRLRGLWQHARDHAPQWVQIFCYAGRDFVVDDGLHWAAAVAYYGLLSLFPLVLAGVAIAAWFIDPHWASQQASQILGHFMPDADTVRDIINRAIANRQRTGLLSVGFLIYAGGRAFSVLIRALNIACDVDEVYGFFRRLFMEIGMLLSIGLLFVGALVSSLLVPLLDDILAPIPHVRGAVFTLIGWTFPALLLLGGFFSLYKFVPRHRCNWQSALLAAGVATVGCLGARPIFVFYVSKLASFSQIYGWLAIGIIFLIWAQIIAVITLYGGELASHIQMMAYDGLSGQEVSRRHQLRSPRRSRASNVANADEVKISRRSNPRSAPRSEL